MFEDKDNNYLAFNTSITLDDRVINQVWQNDRWGDWRYSASAPPHNTWCHIATTYENKTLKTYLNGQLVITNTDSTYTLNTKTLVVNRFDHLTTQAYREDITVIKDQILWTSNFTVPNYILLGDPETPKRLSNRNKIWPIRLKGDYFDKAYIY